MAFCHNKLGDPCIKVIKSTAYFVDFAVPGLLRFSVYRAALSGAILFTAVTCSVTLCDYNTFVLILLKVCAV